MSISLFLRFNWRGWLIGLIFPFTILAVWHEVAELHLFSEQILIPPFTVLLTLVDLFKSGDLNDNIIASLNRVLVGFMFGGASGFIVGLIIGLSPFMNKAFTPMIRALNQVPEYAWMPLIIMCFGLDEFSKIVFISLGAFYPMAFNTYQGVSGVSDKYRELAKVYDYKSYRYLIKVILPNAFPSIITGIRLSLSLSWMFVVGAELFGADKGLGYMMTMGRKLFQIDVVMAGLLVVGAIGFTLNCILQIIESRLLSWRVPFEGGAV